MHVEAEFRFTQLRRIRPHISRVEDAGLTSRMAIVGHTSIYVRWVSTQRASMHCDAPIHVTSGCAPQGTETGIVDQVLTFGFGRRCKTIEA